MTRVNVQELQKHLKELGLETPMASFSSGYDSKVVIEASMTTIMHALQLDLTDDSLRDTPKRIAKMYVDEIFRGLDYANFPKCTTIENKMQADEMICVRDVTLYSTCEHHLVPFIGTATVAYIPNKTIIGLSKINRIVDFFARRPQVQERLTEQVAATLAFILGTEDVAVVMKASHLCVKVRGVQDASSETVTSKLSGKFRENASLRNEFLQLTR